MPNLVQPTSWLVVAYAMVADNIIKYTSMNPSMVRITQAKMCVALKPLVQRDNSQDLHKSSFTVPTLSTLPEH